MKVCKSYLLYAAILAFIGGCTPSTNTPIKAPPAIVQAPLIDHPVTGDTRRAEQLYRSAQSAGEATRNSIMLDSAGLFYRNGNLLRSRNVFAEIDPQRLLDSDLGTQEITTQDGDGVEGLCSKFHLLVFK